MSSVPYTWKQVSTHDGTNGSVWVVFNGKVHDLTNFLKEHPGGEEALLDVAGKDGTQCFEDVGHSDEARALCEKFRIGVISEHPGGEEVLLEQAGQDATESFEDVGHSSDARSMMGKYKVGELAEEDQVKTEKRTRSWEKDPKSPESDNSPWKVWVVPLMIAVAATVLYRLFFMK